MRAVFTKAWSEVRRRRLQSAVIVLMVTLASATITLGLTLLREASSPYDRAFEAQKGAHLQVFYDAGMVTPDQLAATPATLGASSFAGPWPDVYVTLQHGESRYQLDLVGRDSPQGTVAVLRMTAGRWVQAPGEVVVNHSFARQNGIHLGNHHRVSIAVKGREPYRPLGPVALAESLPLLVESTADHRYLAFAPQATSLGVEAMPAAIHVDGTTRIQSVTEHQNPVLYHVLRQLRADAGELALINTSLNVAGKPIADTPADAMECFETTALDVLYLGSRRHAKNGAGRVR